MFYHIANIYMVRLNDVDRQAETETAVRRRPESGRVSIALRPVGRDLARSRRGISKTRAEQEIQSQRKGSFERRKSR